MGLSCKDGRLRRGLETRELLWQCLQTDSRGLGRASRLASEGKSAETHPTVRLRPLGSWLLCSTPPCLERGPARCCVYAESVYE